MTLDIAQYPSQGLVDPIVSTIKRNRELQRIETQKRELIEEENVTHQRSMDVAGILQKQSGDPSAQVKTLRGVSSDVATQATKTYGTFKPEDEDAEIDEIHKDALAIRNYQDHQMFVSRWGEETLKKYNVPFEETGQKIKERDEEAGQLRSEKLASQKALTVQRGKPDKPMTRTQELDLWKKEENDVRIKIDGRSRTLDQADDYTDELDKKIAAKQVTISGYTKELDDDGTRERLTHMSQLEGLRIERDEAIKKVEDARAELQAGNQKETVVGDDEFNKAMDDYLK